MECDICYRSIKNKVSLECSHELCLNCLLEIIKTQNQFRCHMCRKVYVPEDVTIDEEDISIEIEFSKHALFEGEKKLFTDLFPGEECELYQLVISNCSRCIFIIHKDQIPEEVFMRLILCFSGALLSTQNLRDFEGFIPGYKMIPVETHLHDFTNLVIKRVVKVST